MGVQIRTKDFRNYSHQRTLSTPTSSTKIIYENAKQILEEFYHQEPIRLIGIKVDHLKPTDNLQISLFDTKQNEKQNKLDKTIDRLKEKYGYDIITRAGKMETDDMMEFKE